MPNWCSNVATINHGDKLKIDAIEAELHKEKDDIALFQMLRPRPVEFDMGDSWYGWNVDNWGTKWEASVYDFDRIDDHNIRIVFDTAWAPPIAFYEYIFEQGYDTTAYYDECGMAFCGKFEFGSDDYYDYSDMNSDEVQEKIPSDIDEAFCISEQMADREAEEEDDEEEDEDDDTQTYSDDEDDVQTYQTTDWIDVKEKPVRVGEYEVLTGSWPFPQRCHWNGDSWENAGNNLITQWRGITESEHNMLLGLQKLKDEFDALMSE